MRAMRTYALDDVWDLSKSGLLCEGGVVELDVWFVVDVCGGVVGGDGKGNVDVVDLVVEVGFRCPQSDPLLSTRHFFFFFFWEV